jgi:hypothetical protein
MTKSVKAVVLQVGGHSLSLFFQHKTMTDLKITRTIVPESGRLSFVDKLFGISYVLRLEPTVFRMAETLAPDYKGAYWTFYAISNSGFYMGPRTDVVFNVCCPNGFEGKLSAEALGIAACLYTYSNLSFGDDRLAQVCAQQYHLLRELMFEHAEVRAILAAID